MGPRERRERALLAMCIDKPADGRAYVDRLRPEHLSSEVGQRAVAWLRDHLDDPLSGLPRDDEALVSYVTDLRMRADREPGSADAMELNFLELERGAIEDRIAEVRSEGGDAPVELQRRRAELNERIAHFHAVGA
jgi:hypothetical protein